MFDNVSWLRRAAAFFIPLFVAFGVHAALPAGITQGPSVEGITEYKLANGLTVLLFPDASKPTTVVNVTYRVGAAHENYGETGMAHLLEHLVFKGTPNRGNIMQELGRRGMRFNGTTGWDRTNYFETFTASKRQPRLGAVDGSRPDGEFVHPPQRPRLRDDRRPQRVRERREQSAERAVRQDAVHCVPVAQLRTPADRRAFGHRERRHRPAAGVLQDSTTSRTTPC